MVNRLVRAWPGRSYPLLMVLTAEHLKSVLRSFHNRLELHREALNRLNVYPVLDGDTGTNIALTVGSPLYPFLLAAE